MGANVACCGRIRSLVRIVARIAVQRSRGSPLSVRFSSVPCLASTVPFPMTPPYVGRDVIFS